VHPKSDNPPTKTLVEQKGFVNGCGKNCFSGRSTKSKGRRDRGLEDTVCVKPPELSGGSIRGVQKKGYADELGCMSAEVLFFGCGSDVPTPVESPAMDGDAGSRGQDMWIPRRKRKERLNRSMREEKQHLRRGGEMRETRRGRGTGARFNCLKPWTPNWARRATACSGGELGEHLVAVAPKQKEGQLIRTVSPPFQDRIQGVNSKEKPLRAWGGRNYGGRPDGIEAHQVILNVKREKEKTKWPHP